jgi:type IV secretory pathway protease TraF
VSRRIVVFSLVAVAAAAAAAIFANLALLDYASSSNDPVGKLKPQANVPAAPASVIRPQHGHVSDEGADD